MESSNHEIESNKTIEQDNVPKDIMLDDIVFDDRNKKFGAYFNRRVSDQNILWGILFASVIFIITLLAPIAYQKLVKYLGLHLKKENKEIVVREIETIDIIEEEEPEEIEEIQAPPPNIETLRFTEPEIKLDNEIKTPELPPVQTQLDTANQIAKNTNLGVDSMPGLPPSMGGNGNNTLGTKVEDTTVYVGLKEAPYLKDADITEFLSKNLKLPRSFWRSEGGTVVFYFIVEKDGTISDVKFLKKLMDDDLNQEALRVLLLTNTQKWVPAKKDGVPVRMKIKQPVVYPHPDELETY